MTTNQIEQAIDQSTKLSQGTDGNSIATVMDNILRGFIKIGEHVPPYWSRARDQALAEFWQDGAYLSGIMGAASAKLTNIPLVVEARNPNVTSHVNQAAEMTERFNFASEFGQGLYAAMDMYNQDLLGEDNGGFLEVIGGGKVDGPIVGPVISTRHIDSQMCVRTGNVEFPVNVSENGKLYQLHRTRVMFSSLHPSSRKKHNKVGYCAVSRSIEIAHALTTMLNYRNEKMGSRPKSMMLVGQGVSGEELIAAFAVADQIMDSLGLTNFAQIVAIGGGKDTAVKKVDLNTFEPFNEEIQLTLGMHYLALAWGLEPAEIFPVRGSSMASEQVALQRSRGKLPTIYKRDVIAQMGYKMLPLHLKLVAQHTDSIADHQVAVIDDIRARTSHRNLQSGATTTQAERQRMLETGSISREQYRVMNLEDGLLEDGTAIAQLFYKESYQDILQINRLFLIPEVNEGNEDTVRTAIGLNRQLVYFELANSSGARRRRAVEADAALNWLDTLYADPIPPEPVEILEEIPPVNLEDGGQVDGQTKQLEISHE